MEDGLLRLKMGSIFSRSESKMGKFENLNVDAKIVYLLSLSEVIIDNISGLEGYEVAVEALEKCWEWVRYKNVEASELYHCLENMDEIDVMTYLQIADDIEDERVWMCIANALAYTVWEAYQYEKQKYLPQTIECVDYETIDSFIMNFNQIYINCDVVNKLLDYLEINYPINTDKQIDICTIRKFINDSTK